MLVVGDKDIENNTISLRSRKEGDKGAMTLDAFLADALVEIETKAL